MRKIWYCVAMSLDGFIGGPNGEYDWNAFMARFDTVLMGRRSYEASLAMPGGGSMPGLQTYTIPRTLKQEDHPNVRSLPSGKSQARKYGYSEVDICFRVCCK